MKFGWAHPQTAGVEVTQCRAPLSDGPLSVVLFLLDTSGDAAFWDIVPKYWNGVTNALLVYDATDEASLDECEKWHALLMQLRCVRRGVAPVQNGAKRKVGSTHYSACNLG